MRLCKPGDTVCSMRAGVGSYDFYVLLETPEAAEYANDLIRAGRWRVCRYGECGYVVE